MQIECVFDPLIPYVTSSHVRIIPFCDVTFLTLFMQKKKAAYDLLPTDKNI